MARARVADFEPDLEARCKTPLRALASERRLIVPKRTTWQRGPKGSAVNSTKIANPGEDVLDYPVTAVAAWILERQSCVRKTSLRLGRSLALPGAIDKS